MVMSTNPFTKESVDLDDEYDDDATGAEDTPEEAAARRAGQKAREENARSRPNAPYSPFLSPSVRARTPTPHADLKEACFELNRRYGLLWVGSDLRIIAYATEQGEPHREMKLEAFHNFNAPLQYVVTTLTGPQLKPLTRYWLKSQYRRHYRNVVFDPSPTPVAPDVLNLWTGFSVTPKKGDWSKLRKHIFEVLCHENITWFTWMMCWLANIVQDPARKPGTAVVIRGEQGTGKSIVATYVAALMKHNSLSISRPGQLIGRFNSHLAGKLFVTAEEAIWAGSKEGEGVMKDMITSPTQEIEGKGKDLFTVANHLRLWYCSNSEWVVPQSWDDRRYFVLDARNDHRNVKAWFDPIIEQMKQGGLAAMMWDLQNLWIPFGVNLRHPPSTPASTAQKVQSFSSEESWWHHVLSEGELSANIQWPVPGSEAAAKALANFGAADDRQRKAQIEGGLTITCAAVYQSYTDYCRDTKVRYPVNAKQLGKMLASVGVEHTREPTGERKYCYHFKPLEAHREAFTARVGELFDEEITEGDIACWDDEEAVKVDFECTERWLAWAEGGPDVPRG
jgi:hypothetical protein